MFPDRIEILSRGTIPLGQTMEGFFAGESKIIRYVIATAHK